MEWGNPLLDDHVLALSGVRAAQGVLPAHRQRRRRSLRGALLPRVRGAALRAVAHLAVPPRDRRRRPARAPAGPGRDLRRRRQPGLADGHLARARDRRRAARGVAGRGGAVRRLGRLAVLVLARGLSFHEGPARRLEGLGFLPWSNAVHYSDEPGRRSAFMEAVAGGMPPGYGVGDAAALHFVGTDLAEVVSSRRRPGRATCRRRRGRRGRARAAGALSRRGVAAADAASPPAWSWVARRWRRDPAGGAAGSAPCADAAVRHPGGWCSTKPATAAGSWPWAAAASRCRSAVRRWTGWC